MDTLIAEYINPQGDESTHDQAYARISEAFVPLQDGTSSPSLTFQELIVKLELPLTSVDDKERHRATLLIAELLKQHSTVIFSPSIVHLFVVFFCRRLSDYPSIVPSLQALTALVSNHPDSFDPKYFDILEIFQTIFKDVFVQGLAQNIRQRVFELFNLLFDHPTVSNAILGSSEEIMNGILTSFEGEKDPRCLVVSLQVISGMIHAVGDSFTSNYAERVFDCTACYFPITFQPPANDPFGITPEMLIKSLQDCLCAHSNLLPFVLPFLMDQLQSTAISTLTLELTASRIQALQYLLIILGRYSPTVLMDVKQSSTSKPIGELLQRNLLECILASQSPNDNLSTTDKFTLYSISQICMLISSGASGRLSSAWTIFVDPMLTNICSTIADGGVLSLAGRKAFHVACAMASASTICASVVLSHLFPLLWKVVAPDLMSIRRSFEFDQIVRIETHSAALGLLGSLISSIGVPLSDPMESDRHCHADNCNHDTHHGDHHVHSDSCGHSHGASCSSSSSSVSHTNDFNQTSSHQPLPTIDLTRLGAGNPILAIADNLCQNLFASIPSLSEEKNVCNNVDPSAREYINKLMRGNMLGLCEIFLCLKSVLVRVDPKLIPQQQLEHFLGILTFIGIIAPSIVAESGNSSMQLLQQSAIAILSTLTKVSCYSELLIGHTIMPLLRLSDPTCNYPENATKMEHHGQQFPLLEAKSSIISVSLIWQLLGLLCRASLDCDSLTSGDNDIAEDVGDASLEVIKKRSRNSLEGKNNLENKKEVKGSIASVCLPHLLNAVTATTTATASASEMNHMTLRDDAELSVATEAILFLLPQEQELTSITSAEAIVCQYLAGNSAQVNCCPLIALARSASGNEHRLTTVCDILKRVIGVVDVDTQNVLIPLLVETILKLDVVYSNQNQNHKLRLLCAVFSYALPKSDIFAINSIENIVSPIVACLHYSTSQIASAETIYACHLIALILNKLPVCPNLMHSLQLAMDHVIGAVKSCKSLETDTVNVNCSLEQQFNGLMLLAKSILIRPDFKYEFNQDVDALFYQFAGATVQEKLGQFLMTILISPETIIGIEDETGPLMINQYRRCSSLSFLMILRDQRFAVGADQSASKYFNVSKFWKQRLWSRLFPLFTSNIHKYSESQQKTSYVSSLSAMHTENGESQITTALLGGLCILVVDVPASIVSGNVDELIPLVVQGLTMCAPRTDIPENPSQVFAVTAALVAGQGSLVASSDVVASQQAADGDLKNNTFILRKVCVEAILMLMRMKLEGFSIHANVVIPTLAEICKADSRAAVRSTALHCLDAISSLPYNLLHPHKKLVISSLGKALDDKKRSVRLLAATIRNKWCVMIVK